MVSALSPLSSIVVFIFFPEQKSTNPTAFNHFPSQYSAELDNVLTAIFEPETVSLAATRMLAPTVLYNHYLLDHDARLEIQVLRHHLSIAAFEASHSIELVFQQTQIPLSNIVNLKFPLELAVFDLDSTLIEQEVIDEMARSVGLTPAVSAITARAMAGELDFADSLRARVALLEGVKVGVWAELKRSITFAEGARELCRALKRLGVKMAVISGGFIQMAEWVKEELQLDFAYANHLSTSPPTGKYPYPHLTGTLLASEPIIDASAKDSLLRTIAASHGISLSQAMAVGDGANDLAMLNAVSGEGGLGVAFKAKDNVQIKAPNRLNSKSLTDLLHLLRYTDVEIDVLVKE